MNTVVGLLGLRTTDQLTTGNNTGGFNAIKSTYNPLVLNSLLSPKKGLHVIYLKTVAVNQLAIQN